MKIISVNTGQAKDLEWEGKTVRTAILKSQEREAVNVSFLTVGDDNQADVKHHGGTDKAIYSYDTSYYKLWQSTLEQDDLSYGTFGENFTTEGLSDHGIKIGNIYKAGSVVFKATEPRIPCFKLNIALNRKDMFQLFYKAMNYGTYFSVLEEGKVEAGDSIQLIEESLFSITIGDLSEAYATKGQNQGLLKNILDLPILPDNLRKIYKKFLA
jgi:MOSC domain-containing protein YiiM